MTDSEERARHFFEKIPILDRSFMEVWANIDSEELKLFWVRNSTGAPRLFLAENDQLALWVAFSSGDLQNVKNGLATIVDAKYLAADPAFSSALAKAIKAGKPGAVQRFDDGSVRVAGTIYAPLHSVK